MGMSWSLNSLSRRCIGLAFSPLYLGAREDLWTPSGYPLRSLRWLRCFRGETWHTEMTYHRQKAFPPLMQSKREKKRVNCCWTVKEAKDIRKCKLLLYLVKWSMKNTTPGVQQMKTINVKSANTKKSCDYVLPDWSGSCIRLDLRLGCDGWFGFVVANPTLLLFLWYLFQAIMGKVNNIEKAGKV